MPSIADSSAVQENERTFSQQEVVFSIVRNVISDPEVESFHWLDLCCGRGQILIHANENLGNDKLSKIIYHYQDIDENNIKDTKKIVSGITFRDSQEFVSDISNFESVLNNDERYDFVTIINAMHEINPKNFSSLLIECVSRLKESGILYIRDMETINPNELGAITWTREEIQIIVNKLIQNVKITGYNPDVGRAHHTKITSWSIELKRKNIDDAKFEEHKNEIKKDMDEVIKALLKNKIQSCIEALDSYKIYGIETAEDGKIRDKNLYDFYSLTTTELLNE